MIDTTSNEDRLFEVSKQMSEFLPTTESCLLLQEYGFLFAKVQLDRVRRQLWDEGSYDASRKVQSKIDALPGGVA